jgi:glycosyltransferase involved in cell wall biosynthesis
MDTSNNSPLITVIIPTINESATIGVAIQSIVDQTYKNLEIIVVDDGSTDNTEEIVREFEKKDARVKYMKCPYDDPYRKDIRGTNIGVGWVARNYAMDQSKGEWITFQDADDASLLNRIEIQFQLAIKFDAICVTTYSLFFQNEWLGKKLDIERIITERPDYIINPDRIKEIATRTKGPLMVKYHWLIPFVFKKRWPTRLLFIKNGGNYPGSDGVPLFKRETIKEIRFRPRNRREWPAVSGRGVGRDLLFQMATKFDRVYSFKLPLYLWRASHDVFNSNQYEKYLI